MAPNSTRNGKAGPWIRSQIYLGLVDVGEVGGTETDSRRNVEDRLTKRYVWVRSSLVKS